MLHTKNGNETKAIDDVFTSLELKTTAERYMFPISEAIPNDTYQLVHDELMIDGNARQNLATFCTTYEEKNVHKLMDESMIKNMIDKDEYPQTAEIEMRCVHMLADLWNSPTSKTTMGCSTTGSSEAAMLGGLAMKWRWREKMQKLGKPTDKPNLVTGQVQICWDKFARYWDIEIRTAPVKKGQYHATPEQIVALCDENTIGVVSTLGITVSLQFDPVKDIADALDKLQKEKGLDIPMHIDGASGAFLAPFVSPDLVWDFRIPRVKSINASGHKFGLAPLGCGWVVWREESDLPKDLIFYVNYLGGNMPTFALNFSRPGGQVIAQYYLFLRLGREGYRKIQQTCYDTAKYFADGLRKLGIFDIIADGTDSIPGVVWTLNSKAPGTFNLYDMATKLRSNGWLVPAYTLPPDCTDIVVERVLIRHGVSTDLIDFLLADIVSAIKDFEKNPVQHHTEALTGTAFHH